MDQEQIHARRWWTLAVLCISLLVIVMDNTILNVALPTLQRDLHATQSDLQWLVDSYTLVFAGLLLTMGSISDRYGRKTLLFFGFIVFGTGSLLASQSKSPLELTAARAFMGIGGASIMPSTLSIITNVFHDPKERGRAIGMWAAVAGLGIALGPVTGGYLLQHFYWGSVFMVNIPILIFGLIAGWKLIPQSFDTTKPQLDLGGALLSILGLGTLVWAIIEAPDRGWLSAPIIAVAAIGIVLLISFALWEKRSTHPMLDVRFFENPRFSAASLSITFTFFVLYGALFGVTLYLQDVLGYTAFQAGLRIMPYAFTMMFASPMAPRVSERIGTKNIVAFGMAAIGTSLLLMLNISRTSGYMPVFWAFEVMAIGMSAVFSPATESIMGSLPRNKAGVGSAVNDTTRQVGGAMGVAILGSIVNSGYSNKLATSVASLALPKAIVTTLKQALDSALSIGGVLRGDPKAAQNLTPAQLSQINQLKTGLGANAHSVGNKLVVAGQNAYTDALKPAFLVGAVICFIGMLLVYKFLPARAKDVAEAANSMDAEDETLSGATV